MIDMERIEELREEIGTEDLGLVIRVFLGEAEETLAGLTRGLAQAERARVAHFLRSGALNIGFSGVARLTDGLERGEWADVAGAVADLREGLAVSRDELGPGLA